MPQTIPYQNRYSEAMSGQNDLGQNISRMVLGLAVERQRQQQQQFLNSIRISELQRQAYLDQAHTKLWGEQSAAAQARGELDKAKVQEMQGLSKLAEAVSQATMQHSDQQDQMSHVMDSGGPSVENAEKQNSLASALRQSAAAQKAALMSAAVLKSSPASQLMIPRNIGGRGVNALGEDLGGSEPKPQFVNRPYGSDLYMQPPGADMPTLVAKGQPTQPKYTDPTAQLAHVTTAMDKLDASGLSTEQVVNNGMTNTVPTAEASGLRQWMSDIIQMRGQQPSLQTPPMGTNAPLPNIKSIKRIR